MRHGAIIVIAADGRDLANRRQIRLRGGLRGEGAEAVLACTLLRIIWPSPSEFPGFNR